VFDSVGLVELVVWWWNSHWRGLRRDIIVGTDGRQWIVRGRIGGYDGPEVVYKFGRPYEARAMVDRLKAAEPGTWKDITSVVRRSPPAR
jgi:hypothetical protein